MRQICFIFWLHLLNECSNLQLKHGSTACLHHKSKHYVHGLSRFTYGLKVIQFLPASPPKGIPFLHWLSEVVTDVQKFNICRGQSCLSWEVLVTDIWNGPFHVYYIMIGSCLFAYCHLVLVKIYLPFCILSNWKKWQSCGPKRSYL